MMAQGCTQTQICKVTGVSTTTAYNDMEEVRRLLEAKEIHMHVISRQEVAAKFIKLGEIAQDAAQRGLEDGIRARGRDDITPDRIIREGRMPARSEDPYPYGNPEYIDTAARMYSLALKAAKGEFVGYNRDSTEGREMIRKASAKAGIADVTFDAVMSEAFSITPEMEAEARDRMEKVVAESRE